MTVDDELEIPSGGAVFTFGKSRFADNAPSKFWIKNDEITAIACGDQHTAVLTGSGRVFTIGSNDQGQLGLNSRAPVVKPSCVKALKCERTVLVACGRAHTLAATDTGGVYSWGHNDEGQLGTGNIEDSVVPQLVLSLPAPPVALAAGSAHSVLLTGTGEVLVWGSNSCGQLGLQTRLQTTPTPVSLHCAVRQVACGYYHTLLVTEEGTLLTFGEATDGKLGRDPEFEHQVPHPVPGLSQRVSRAAAGAKHSLILTEAGVVLSSGSSSAGQLGQGPDVKFSPNFQPIAAPDDVTFVAIAAGHAHSAALTSTGQVYVWGCGRHGKLGSGDLHWTSHYSPILLSRLRHLTSALVGCGGCHSMVLGYPPSAITPPHLHKNSTMLPPLRGGSALPPLTPAAPQVPTAPPASATVMEVSAPSASPEHSPNITAAPPSKTAASLSKKASQHNITAAPPSKTGSQPSTTAAPPNFTAAPPNVPDPITAAGAPPLGTHGTQNEQKGEAEGTEGVEGEQEEDDDEEEELDESDNGKHSKKGNALVRFLSHWSRRKTSSSPQDDPPDAGLLDPQGLQAPASTPVPHTVRPVTDGGADEELDLLDAEESPPAAPSAAEVTQASLQLPADDDKGHGGIVQRLRALRKVNNITDGQLEETHVPQHAPHDRVTHVPGSPDHVDAVQSKACVLL